MALRLNPTRNLYRSLYLHSRYISHVSSSKLYNSIEKELKHCDNSVAMTTDISNKISYYFNKKKETLKRIKNAKLEDDINNVLNNIAKLNNYIMKFVIIPILGVGPDPITLNTLSCDSNNIQLVDLNKEEKKAQIIFTKEMISQIAKINYSVINIINRRDEYKDIINFDKISNLKSDSPYSSPCYKFTYKMPDGLTSVNVSYTFTHRYQEHIYKYPTTYENQNYHTCFFNVSIEY